MNKTISNIPKLDLAGDFFSLYFRHNPLPMWVFDIITLSFLDVNLSAIQSYGYSREEFLSMTIKDIRPADDIEFLESYVPKVKEKSNSGYRWRHLKKDGTCSWVTISSLHIFYKGMNARVVTVNEVTRYKEQEQELWLANKELSEYKKAVTTSSIVSITSISGIIEYVNDNFTNLTGYTRDELIGSNHNVINSGLHPQDFWQEMWDTVLKGNPWRGEVCNRKKNGELYWVDSFIIPLKNDGDTIDRIFAIRTDITERKSKETEVIRLNQQLVIINLELTKSKKELEKLSLVAKLTASEVLILNKNSQIVWVNDAFTHLTGYTLAEAYGKKPSEFLHGPNSPEETTALIKAAISKKEPFNTEVIHYSKSGKEFCLITDGQPVLDDAGNLLQYVIVETDITELKEKQQAVRNSEAKLNAFFSTTANLHLLVDTHLNVLAFNKVAEDFILDIMQTGTAAGDYLPGLLPGLLKENFIYFANEAINGNATVGRVAEIQLRNEKLIWMVH